jgi:hypothetical protein
MHNDDPPHTRQADFHCLPCGHLGGYRRFGFGAAVLLDASMGASTGASTGVSNTTPHPPQKCALVGHSVAHAAHHVVRHAVAAGGCAEAGGAESDTAAAAGAAAGGEAAAAAATRQWSRASASCAIRTCCGNCLEQTRARDAQGVTQL